MSHCSAAMLCVTSKNAERLKKSMLCVRFEALTAVKTAVFVFWVVTPCTLVGSFGEHAASIFRAEVTFFGKRILYRVWGRTRLWVLGQSQPRKEQVWDNRETPCRQ